MKVKSDQRHFVIILKNAEQFTAVAENLTDYQRISLSKNFKIWIWLRELTTEYKRIPNCFKQFQVIQINISSSSNFPTSTRLNINNNKKKPNKKLKRNSSVSSNTSRHDWNIDIRYSTKAVYRIVLILEVNSIETCELLRGLVPHIHEWDLRCGYHFCMCCHGRISHIWFTLHHLLLSWLIVTKNLWNWNDNNCSLGESIKGGVRWPGPGP